MAAYLTAAIPATQVAGVQAIARLVLRDRQVWDRHWLPLLRVIAVAAHREITEAQGAWPMCDEQGRAAVAGWLDTLLPRSAASYRYDLDAWVRWCDSQGTTVLGASRQDVARWVAARQDDGLTPRSVGSALSRIRSFYRWAGQEGLVEADPTALVRAPARGRSDRAWLCWADLARLLQTSLTWRDGALAAHVHLWGLAGLRPGEPRLLQVSDLSSHDGQPVLRVRASKTAGRERVALAPTAAALLEQATAGRRRGTLLVHPLTGRAWTAATEQAALRGLCRAARVPQVTAYGLRTSFITLAIDAGMAERDVSVAARHATTAQTAAYDRLRTQVAHPVGPRLETELRSRTTQPADKQAA